MSAPKKKPAVTPDVQLEAAADKVAAMRVEFIEACHAFAKRANIAPSTAGLYALGDGKGLARIEAGGDIQLKQLERAYRNLAKRTRDGGAKPKPGTVAAARADAGMKLTKQAAAKAKRGK